MESLYVACILSAVMLFGIGAIDSGLVRPNPKRPPKGWWKSCTQGVKKTGATDSDAVCGANWFHKMTPRRKRAALRRERS